MNFTKILQFAAGAVVVLVVAGFFVRRAGGAAVEAVANINEGTPFEDTGVIGTVGNVTDLASGRTLSRFGSFLGLQASKTLNFFRTGEFV